MDTGTKFKNPNPRLKANYLSQLFFCWLVPTFWYGRRNDFEQKDIYNVLPKDVSGTLGDKLESNWKRELDDSLKSNRKPSFQKAIQKTFLWRYMMLGIYTVFYVFTIKNLQPIALGYLIGHFAPGATSSTSDAYIYASIVILMTFMESIIFSHTTYQARELGMALRVACSSLIYRKVMKLSCASAAKASGGLVINLLSNDVVRFEQVFVFLHYIWIVPFQTALVAYFIWRSVGIASLVGVAFMILQTIPFQVYFGRRIHSMRKKVAMRTDRRVLLMNEIINGIRVIKMYTWEPVFQQLVYVARRYELDVIVVANYLKGATWASFTYAQRTALFATILVYALQGNAISADKVFAIAQFYSNLQLSMAIFFPRGLNFYAEAKVSINRIQNFLLFEEVESINKSLKKSNDKATISIEKVSASWTADSICNTLTDINVTIPNKNLYTVVGPVGAGKSSFLKLILGEFRPSTGLVSAYGTVSYASQEPWLFTGSVRANILFGQPYNEERYKTVTRVCCLLEDFEQLPHGDRTLVGERGTSLSGGQCARVNLARAVYRDADIYLLDDPLSAVDTRVSKRLFQDCINGYLKDKTRILVTHQIQFLKEADSIVYLENGKIEYQGNFDNFRKHNKHFEQVERCESVENPPTEEPTSEDNADAPLDLPTSNDDENREEPKETEELVVKGDVTTSLYWKYFKANGSYLLLFLFAVIYVLAQVISSGGDYWIAFWTRQEEARPSSFVKAEKNNSISAILPLNISIDNDTISVLSPSIELEQDFDRNTALYIYGILVSGSVILSTGRNILLYKICRNASYNIHNLMINCILKAPMKFFELNPSGRILNRFSKDLGAVDEILSMALIETFQVFSLLLGVMVQILIINWWMILPMSIMFAIHLYIKSIYLTTAQSVKRLEGNVKSPVFSHANSSLSGLLTIRSCRAESMVCKEFDGHQDVHTSAFFLVLSTSTAFGFWIDLVSICFVAVVTYSFIILDHSSISGDTVGLAITQVLIISGVLQHGMKMAAEMVSQMIGVERLFQFTKLEQEGPFESEPGKEPPKTWPSKGEVKFEHLYLRYGDAVEPVLKNLTLNVEPGMKVGIVGRTGAGKSSLIVAIFRLTKIEGSLYIDGVDTKRIGLRDLRGKLSIIPQEPMLFSASLRDNLDPFHEFEDTALWSALRDVELNRAFVSLDQFVDQSGANLSAGQRQLLCLARAIIKRNKVLVLDEATANVDPATDTLIQKSIRINFKDCTVLTIAHRLNTIMDSDRVLVMNHGEAVEFDHPHILLQKNNGYFTKMVEQTGHAMAEHLKKIAEKAYKNKVGTTDVVIRTAENGNNRT